MKLLHVDSSILGNHSASRQLSAALVSEIRRRIPTLSITYRDLAAKPLDHLSGAHLAAAQADPASLSGELSADLAEGKAALDEFLAADIVVIGAPIYNFAISSQLKTWIDRLAVAGKTFRYTENGPVGLAGGKTLIIASSRGGVSEPSTDFLDPYLRHLFAFMGIDNVHTIRAEGLAMGDEARKQAMDTALASIPPLTSTLFAAA